MEPSQLYGVSEECHSSESGWTMYIGSPVNSSNDDETSTDIADYANGGEGYDYTDAINEDESDDSMASDASSGPSNQGHSLALFHRKKKPLMEEKKQQKKKETKLEKKKKKEEEREDQTVFSEKKGRVSSVKSSGKVKKTFWVAKTTDN